VARGVNDAGVSNDLSIRQAAFLVPGLDELGKDVRQFRSRVTPVFYKASHLRIEGPNRLDETPVGKARDIPRKQTGPRRKT
jgi:hypothetical protein